MEHADKSLISSVSAHSHIGTWNMLTFIVSIGKSAHPFTCGILKINVLDQNKLDQGKGEWLLDVFEEEKLINNSHDRTLTSYL